MQTHANQAMRDGGSRACPVVYVLSDNTTIFSAVDFLASQFASNILRDRHDRRCRSLTFDLCF